MESSAVAEKYQDDGYVVFRDVLDRDLVDKTNRHVDWLLEQHPDRRPEDLTHELARTDPFWIDLVSDDRLLDIAEQFIGPDIALFATHYICKPPRTGKMVHWHQDGAFWPLEPMNVVSLWLAVTDSDTGNGCLRVVPGSHTDALAQMRTSGESDAVFDQETVADVDTTAATDLVLGKGDVSVHHPNIHHSSNPNQSDRWRRGLTIRYIPTSTRITDPESAVPFVLRGTPVPGINDYLERPVHSTSSFDG